MRLIGLALTFVLALSLAAAAQLALALPASAQIPNFPPPSISDDERGWRATFYASGMEHSPTSATGKAWERTPWHATQRAAWEVLRKVSD